MLFPASKLGDNLIGLDLHDVMGATPSPAGPIPTPVPKFPHPFTGTTMLWHSPAWPMMNVTVNGTPAASLGCKGYSAHFPPILPPPVVFVSWLPPAQITPKWYLQNLATVAVSTAFQLIIGVVRGMVDPLVTGRGDVPSVWGSIKGTLGGLSWLQLFQSLLPPAVLPVSEGNISIGSPTVLVNGSPMALVGPMFASSCTTFPATLAPNASVLGFSNVMVGLSLTDFLLQVFWNGVNAAASQLAGKVVEKYKCKLGLEPIDLVSGCNFEDKTDFTLPGMVPLEWTRAYRSLKAYDGPLGFGWTYPLGQYLEAAADGFDYVNDESMRYRIPFIETDGASLVHPTARFVVTRVSATVYTIRLRDRRVLAFEWPELSARAYLTAIGDLNGNAIQLRYDRQRRVMGLTDTHRRALAIDYDDRHRIVAVRLTGAAAREANITLVRYEYDPRGDLTAVYDAANNATRYEYDEQHWMTRKTDRNGYSFHYRYNSVGQCIKSWGDDGLYGGELEYFPLARTTIFTVPNGSKHVYRHDEQNLVTAIIDGYGAARTFQYNAHGDLEAEIDPNGNARTFKYDEQGNMVEERDFAGRKWKRKYNELGQLVEEVNPSGAKREWTYDGRGNLVEELRTDGTSVIHTVNARGQCERSRSGDDPGVAFEYDPSGQLARAVSANGIVLESYDYDARGNLVAHRIGLDTLILRYDALARRIETLYPDRTSERYAFDKESNLLGSTDRFGRNWSNEYRSWNLLTTATDPGGGATRLSYDNAAEIVRITTPGEVVTENARDLNDLVVRVSRGGQPAATYDRDRAGYLVRRTASDGGTIETVMGAGELVRSRTSKAGPVNRFEYDEAARLSASEVEGLRVTAKADAHDRIVEMSWNSDRLSQVLDLAGRLTQAKWSEGWECAVEHDAEGRRILDPLRGSHTICDCAADVAVHQLPNGLAEVRNYDPAGHLIGICLCRAGNDKAVVLAWDFRYDTRGNLVSYARRPDQFRLDFRYDLLDRLTGVSGSGLARAIRYDAGGNPLDDDAAAAPLNRLRRWGGVEYEYDGVGRVVVRRAAGQRWSFRYDDANRLIAATGGGGGAITFGYDATDKRAWKEAPDGRTEFQWYGSRLHREIRQDRRRTYIYFEPERPTPNMFIDQVDLPSGPETRAYYIHAGPTGLPLAVTAANGAVVWRLDPQPFAEWSSYDPHVIDFNLRYPGQYEDRELGLCSNGYRTFDPCTNRFLQPDPIGLGGGLNLYAYPYNPLTETDPLGLAGSCASSKPSPEDNEPTATPLGERDPMLGGGYGRVRARHTGGEVNHVPPASVSPWSHETTPAIAMSRDDHRALLSTGSSAVEQAHRARQQALIDQGHTRAAVLMDVRDIQQRYPGKYDQGLQEMINHYNTKCDPSQRISPSHWQ